MFKRLIAVFFLSCAANYLMADFKALEQEYRKLYSEKKLDECITKCEEAFKEAGSERDKWETFFFRYHCYMRLKKYDEAMKIAIEAQKLPKYAWRGYIFQIQCLMSQKKYAEALDVLKPDKIKDWPEDGQTQYYMETGNAAFCMKNYDDALKNYEQGLAAAKKTYWKKQFLSKSGDTLSQKAEFDKAIAKYNEVLTLSLLDDTAKSDIYSAIGMAYERQKKYTEAAEAYLEGSKCPKAHGTRIPNSLANAARVLQQNDDNAKALELYQKALAHKNCNAGLKKYIELKIERLEK